MLIIKRNSRDFKSKVKQFKEFCNKKDRMTHPYHTYMILDVEDMEYKIRSEWNITHNQIVVMKCQIPPKSDKDPVIEIKEVKYAWE